MRLRAGESGHDPDLARRLDGAFGRYESALRNLCRRELTGFPEQQVEEAVQEVLLVAWRRLPEFRGESRFRSWLFAIASRTCANLRRRKRDVLTEDGVFEADDPAESAFARLERAERDALLEAASAAVLDATEQEVIYLRYVREASAEEIAADVGFSDPDQVRVVLQRCQRRLHKELRARLEALGHGTSLLGLR